MRLDEFQNLNEMIVRYNNEQGNQIIAFKDSIWIIDDEDDLDDPDAEDYYSQTAHEIADKLGYDSPDELDVHELAHERPDVLTGRIDRDDRVLYISHTGIMQHPVTSKLMRKVVKQLGILDVEVEHVGSTGAEKTRTYARNDISGDLPTHGYHGTSLRRAAMILKQGIRPQDKSNWGSIWTEGTIFFGSGIEDPEFHATRTAAKSMHIPVVLYFKVPDKNLIIPDYDVAGTIYGSGNKALANTVYKNTDFPHRSAYRDHIQKASKRPEKLYQGFNIFGYKGRIPPSYLRAAYCTFEEIDPSNLRHEPEFYPISIPELKELVQIVDELGTEMVTPELRGVTFDELMNDLRDEDED